MVPDFLTVEEVAATLRVSERFVTKLALAGNLPACKVGRLWRIERAAFLTWLRERQPRQWRRFTGVAASGGLACSGTARKSDGQLDRLLSLKRSDFLTNSKRT